MDATVTQPYERLLQTLTVFASSARAAQPAAAPVMRWTRAVSQLQEELDRLRSFAPGAVNASPGHSEQVQLQRTAHRLTMLARTQDGLRFEQSAGKPAEQLLGERRSVVFAAWQLLQVLEQAGSGSTQAEAVRGEK